MNDWPNVDYKITPEQHYADLNRWFIASIQEAIDKAAADLINKGCEPELAKWIAERMAERELNAVARANWEGPTHLLEPAP